MLLLKNTTAACSLQLHILAFIIQGRKRFYNRKHTVFKLDINQ